MTGQLARLVPRDLSAQVKDNAFRTQPHGTWFHFWLDCDEPFLPVVCAADQHPSDAWEGAAAAVPLAAFIRAGVESDLAAFRSVGNAIRAKDVSDHNKRLDQWANYLSRVAASVEACRLDADQQPE